MNGLGRIAALLLGVGLGASAAATQRYVSPDGDDGNDGTAAHPFKTLARALEASYEWNSTLWVSNGVYKLDAELTFGHNGLLLRSYTGDPKDVVIDAQGKGRCINAGANYSVYLCGLTFVNGQTSEKGGALWLGDLSKVYDCVISNCTAGTDGGAIYANGATTISRLILANCTAGGNGGGFSGYGGSNPRTDLFITNCVAGGHGGGIYINANGGPALHDCTIVDCHARAGDGGGVYAYAKDVAGGSLSTNVTIRNCSATSGDAVSGGGAACSPSTISGAKASSRTVVSWTANARATSGDCARSTRARRMRAWCACATA